MDGNGKGGGILRSAQSVDDMTIFVQCLLQEMHSRLRTLTESMKAKLDELGARLDALDYSIKESRLEIGENGMISSPPDFKTDDTWTA